MDISNATLQQIQLLPSGCQIWHRDVLAASPSGNLVAYASTVGICVFDISANPIVLKRVLGNRDISHKTIDNIIYIAWHPTDEDVLVSTSEVDIMLWNLQAPRPCQSTTALPKPIVRIAWSLHNPNIMAVSCINTRVYEWDVASAVFRECYSRPSRIVRNGKNEINVTTALAWHPINPQLMCGQMDGTWTLWDSKAKSNASPTSATQFAKTSQTNARIVDMSWEKLGGSYALVVYQRSIEKLPLQNYLVFFPICFYQYMFLFFSFSFFLNTISLFLFFNIVNISFYGMC